MNKKLFALSCASGLSLVMLAGCSDSVSPENAFVNGNTEISSESNSGIVDGGYETTSSSSAVIPGNDGSALPNEYGWKGRKTVKQ